MIAMRQISQEQVLDRLRAENPWWESDLIPPSIAEFKPRPYMELFFPLVERSGVQRAVVLMGPRRVGKTVLIHHTIDRLLRSGVNAHQICYVSVDHPIYTGLGLGQILDLFHLAAEPSGEAQCYVFFDEVQYLRDWEVHLKALVDERRPIQFVASGSAAAALRLQSNESGAGRFTDFFLPPLTFYEFLALLGEDSLVDPQGRDADVGSLGIYATTNLERLNELFVDYINFGGYPEVVLSPAVRADMERFIKSDIVDKVLLRDLPSLYGIRDTQELNYLFTTLAFNSANEVSLEGLSKNSGVAKNTLKRYIEYLEAAFLVKVIHRVDRNAKRFKRQNFFKVYLANPSMRAALFSPVSDGDPSMGELAETAAFAQWFHMSSLSHLHYARWSDGEVDLVSVAADQAVSWAAEIKWSDRMVEHPNECDRYIDFAKRNGLSRLVLTTKTKARMTERGGVNLIFVPLSLYCFTIGFNVVASKKGELERGG